MANRAQAVDGETGLGDLLVKIRGRHYLIPAEAIGSPLDDGGTEILGMLEKELTAVSAARESRRRDRTGAPPGGDSARTTRPTSHARF